MSRFDVVVIGGGPAGMMAAARAAQYGARTVLIEKNRELGKKLMITGRGRCNYAHDEEDPETLAKNYRNGGEFLLPSLRNFGTKETTAFFLRRGIVPEHERGQRIYPREGMDAGSIVNALWTALKDSGVHILRGAEVRAIDFLGGKARRVTTAREEIEGGAFIIATGGLSFPMTGSTGDGYRFARKAGHNLIEARPALCPVKIADTFDEHLSGLKLKNVRVTLRENGVAVDERFGEMDFTPFGISGAIIMDMASSIGASLKKGVNATISIDLKPALDPERLDARIGRDFEELSTDALRFALRKMLPGQLIPEVIKKAGLDMGKPCGQTTPEERLVLRNTLKSFIVTPTELFGFHHAIITAGGVDTDQIDPLTMRSKLIGNLYFAGEVLNVDGPTGGYNLQECWTTGYTAGSAAAESLGFAAPTDEEIVKQMVAANDRRMEMSRAGRKSEILNDTEKESNEDMTIKTGPTDNPEFCGWRDPRKEKTTKETTNSKEYLSEENRAPREDNRHERPRGKFGKERSFRRNDRGSEHFERRERNFSDSDRSFSHDRGERRFDHRDNDRNYSRSQREDSRFSDRQDRPYRPYRDDEGSFRTHERRPYGEEDFERRNHRDDATSRFDRRSGENSRFGGYGERRPQRDYEDRRPRREFNEERPYRDFNDDRPRRDFDNRTSRSFDDRRTQRRFGENEGHFERDRRSFDRSFDRDRRNDSDHQITRSRFDDRKPHREDSYGADRRDNFNDRPRAFGDDHEPRRDFRRDADRPFRRPSSRNGQRTFDRGEKRGYTPRRDDRAPASRTTAEHEHNNDAQRPRRFTNFERFRDDDEQ